jgi:glycosyltransferase involved in cell wall biosynthesis
MSAPFPCVGLDVRLWHRTGIGRYLRNLAPRLHGIDLVLWALPRDVETVRAAVPSATVCRCSAPPFSVKELLFWPRELRRQPVDVFHAPHINIPLGLRVPLVVTLHDLIPLRFRGAIHSWLGNRYFERMSALAAARAQRLIAVSENTRRDLVCQLRANPARIRTIAEAADPRFGVRASPLHLEQVRQRHGLHGPYLLYVGQWKPHKNLETLLRAFARLRARHPRLQLVLAGREDPRQVHVPHLIAALNLQEAVVRTGYLRNEDELVSLFQGAAVLAHPSRYEGFGLPPLEAMAAGVPVVASNAASLPEVVGEAGMLVPPDDIERWSEALEQALLNEPLRRELVQAGYERARAFTWERAAQQTVATYFEALRETTAQPLLQTDRLWRPWLGVRAPRSSFGL